VFAVTCSFHSYYLVFAPQAVAYAKHRGKIGIWNMISSLPELSAFVAPQIKVKSGLKVKPFANKELVTYAAPKSVL